MTEKTNEETIEGLKGLRNLYEGWRATAQKHREFVRDGYLGVDTERMNTEIDNLSRSIDNIAKMISDLLGDRPAEKD